MTEEQLNEYIERINSGNYSETIITRKISSKVSYARLWTKEPELSDKPNGYPQSYKFFFIKDNTDKFIGAVLDMSNDLHWYIKKGSRKKGHLSQALKQTILPFIFYEKDKQRITISKDSIGEKEYENSKKVAIRLGFTPVDESESEFKLLKENFDWSEENINWEKEDLSKERKEILRRKLSYSIRQIKSVSEELKLKNQDDFGLEEIVYDLGKYVMNIEDIPRRNN